MISLILASFPLVELLAQHDTLLELSPKARATCPASSARYVISVLPKEPYEIFLDTALEGQVVGARGYVAADDDAVRRRRRSTRLGSHVSGGFVSLGVGFRVELELHETFAVAQVDEDHAAQIAAAVDPPSE